MMSTAKGLHVSRELFLYQVVLTEPEGLPVSMKLFIVTTRKPSVFQYFNISGECFHGFSLSFKMLLLSICHAYIFV